MRERKEDFLSCSAIFPTDPQATFRLESIFVFDLLVITSLELRVLWAPPSGSLQPHHPSDSFYFFCGELGTKWYFATLSVLSSERWTSQSEKTRIDQMLSFQHSVSVTTVALHHELRKSVLTSGWFPSFPCLPFSPWLLQRGGTSLLPYNNKWRERVRGGVLRKYWKMPGTLTLCQVSELRCEDSSPLS